MGLARAILEIVFRNTSLGSCKCVCKVLFPYHEGKYCFQDEMKVTVLYPLIDTAALLEPWILNPLTISLK